VKSRLARDAAMIGGTLAGAALQWRVGGPWLLIGGSAAMGLRISFMSDDKRGLASALSGCLLWYFLHWLLGNLTRVEVASEILSFSALMVVFWLARLKYRERVAEEARRLREMQDTGRVRTERLKQLDLESDGMIRESEEWSKLFGVTRGIGEVIREDDIIEVVREAAQTHLKLPAYALLLLRDGEIRIRTHKGFDDDVLRESIFADNAASLASWFTNQKDPVLVDNVDTDNRFPGRFFPYRSVAALPMRAHEQALGVLLAFDSHSRVFSRQDFARATILAKQLALGIRKTMLYSLIEELSITDGLTKLYRHRYFMDRFDGELERARRYSRPVSLLMGDLDFMKRVNDTYGHQEGDAVLKLTARVMEQYFKRPAIVARYGGDEFAVLLPDVDGKEAVEMAERFRLGLSETPIPAEGERPPLTMSIGVSSFPADAQSRRDLIARADAALYKVKEEGKNRVRAYDPSLGTASPGRG